MLKERLTALVQTAPSGTLIPIVGFAPGAGVPRHRPAHLPHLPDPWKTRHPCPACGVRDAGTAYPRLGSRAAECLVQPCVAILTRRGVEARPAPCRARGADRMLKGGMTCPVWDWTPTEPRRCRDDGVRRRTWRWLSARRDRRWGRVILRLGAARDALELRVDRRKTVRLVCSW
jgi:hypothetical protein